MPCIKCIGGDVQCGEDAVDLCAGSGMWKKAGALCLEFSTRIKNGKVILKIDIKPQENCGGNVIIIPQPESPLQKPDPKTAVTKGKKKKK